MPLFLLLLVSVSAQRFPPDFKFGLATAAYQIEGGWAADGKGESIWDRLTHSSPQLIADHSTGDTACDSYRLWAEDVEALVDLGVDHYRFSLSWPRILPGGRSNTVSPAGVAYYNALIDKLLANHIAPMVTLYHWDLPQSLQDLGGWTNPRIADYFEEFARVAFEQFGDRVKRWITINEPSSICVDTYEADVAAPPFVKSPGIGLYLCGKTVLMAHARAYRLYDAVYRGQQQGKIGLTIDSIWAEPRTAALQDVEAAERELQMSLGWWAHPVFSKAGNYPAVMSARIANFSRLENFAASRLPPLSPLEVKMLRGSADFLGLNHYHTWLIADDEDGQDGPSYRRDRGTVASKDPRWKPSPEVVPFGLRKLLNWIRLEYGNPLVIITENGFGDKGGVDDGQRVGFLRSFMNATLEAVVRDGCNVQGYTIWSLMDNMEWRSGYTVKFGVYDVNFTDPGRERTIKKSGVFLKKFLKTRILPPE